MKIYKNSLFSTTTQKVGQVEKPIKIAKDRKMSC